MEGDGSKPRASASSLWVRVSYNKQLGQPRLNSSSTYALQLLGSNASANLATASSDRYFHVRNSVICQAVLLVRFRFTSQEKQIGSLSLRLNNSFCCPPSAPPHSLPLHFPLATKFPPTAHQPTTSQPSSPSVLSPSRFAVGERQQCPLSAIGSAGNNASNTS